ncbi:hypothetical protein RhiJN_24446 [Ceratobasidium sp. AG-Ba]|nr:hypothetical protein RhiJN_24446 [Ceratobasidium sp. AG-Ba]
MTQVATQSKPVEHFSVAGAFSGAYEPLAESALYDFLVRCEGKFRQRGYYGKFCHILQSSGTSKSRTMVELSRKGLIVLYMKIGSDNKANEFPPGDEFPTAILTKNVEDITFAEYADRCVALFTAIFHVLKGYLSERGLTREEVIGDWSSEMLTFGGLKRANLFALMNQEYQTVLKRIQEIRLSKGVSHTYGNVKELGPQLVGEYIMTKAYDALLSTTQVLDAYTRKPQLVIVLDEAQKLRQCSAKYCASSILCRVVSALSNHQPIASIWTALVSSSSRIVDPPPAPRVYSGMHISSPGNLIFPPFSALSWDQHALPPGSVQVENVGQFDHMVRFGRPLWQSLIESGLSPMEVLSRAREKICHGKEFDASDFDQALALLGQRFLLNIYFGAYDSKRFIDKAISGHLRVCIRTTEDRTRTETSYPSEPFLSFAVAQLLYTTPVGKNTPYAIETALVSLEKAVKGNVDFTVRQRPLPSVITAQDQLPDCEPISVESYFETMFGKASLAHVDKGCLDGWYINFSHWVGMSERVEFGESHIIERMQEWLWLLWTRTSAIQCCPDHPAFDKVIPMYKPDIGEYSFILIASEAGAVSSLATITNISSQNADLPPNKNFYIAVLADLGVESGSVEVSIKQEADINVARIYAPGIGVQPYGFMKATSSMATCLRRILSSHDKETEAERRGTDVANYGASCDPRHMNWK